MDHDYRVVKCDDGKYRWIYDLDLKKNPAVLKTVFAVLGISFLVLFVFLSLLSIRDHQFMEMMRDMLPVILIVMAVVGVIAVISYAGIGIYYKWTFSFMYEMDDEGIRFRRIGSDAEKTEAIGNLSMLTGFVTGNLGLIGGGMNLAHNADAYSQFSKVRRVRAVPDYDLIKVDSLFLFNQVYVGPDDYDFVLEFIEARTGKPGR